MIFGIMLLAIGSLVLVVNIIQGMITGEDMAYEIFQGGALMLSGLAWCLVWYIVRLLVRKLRHKTPQL